MNKEKYEKPICEVLIIEMGDVITFSLGGSGDEIPFKLGGSENESQSVIYKF